MARTFQHKLGAVALVVLTLLVGTLRPLARVSGRSPGQSGLSRLAFVLEPPSTNDPPFSVLPRAHVHVLVPAALAALLIALKGRRLAFISIPVRHLKIPPSRNEPTAYI